jgi:cell division protein FtsL
MAVLNRTIPHPQAREPERTRPTVRVGPVLLLACAAAVVVGLLQVVQMSEATTTNFAIQKRAQEKLVLEASVRDLEAEIAALSSISRVEREAQRLGLKAAASRKVVEVNVAWPGSSSPLPSDLVPEDEERSGADEDAPLWRDVINLLPVN